MFVNFVSYSFISLANQTIKLYQTCVCCVVFGLPIIASQKMVDFNNVEVKEFIIARSQQFRQLYNLQVSVIFMKLFWCPQVVEGSLDVKYRNGCEPFKRKSLSVFERGVNCTKSLQSLNRPSSLFTYILFPSSTFIYLHQLSFIFPSSTSTSLHSLSCTFLYLVFIYLYSALSTFTSP